MADMEKEEALQILDTIPTIGEQVDALEMEIIALEQESKWIPVSERMPEEYEDVLVCTDAEEVFIAELYMDDGKIYFDDNNGMFIEGNIVAWMPLPKTYKAESEDKHIAEESKKCKGVEMLTPEAYSDLCIRASMGDELKSKVKAFGEDMRLTQGGITDEKVLIGFNMAVAISNKHLAESEDKE